MRRYIVSLGVMVLVGVLSLVIVSTLTYLFKWQADKAMVGIIVTYVLAGMSGGMMQGYADKKRGNDVDGKSRKIGSIKWIFQVGLLVVLFLVLQLVLSFVFFKNGLDFSKQTLLVIILVFGSAYMGRILVK